MIMNSPKKSTLNPKFKKGDKISFKEQSSIYGEVVRIVAHQYEFKSTSTNITNWTSSVIGIDQVCELNIRHAFDKDLKDLLK